MSGSENSSRAGRLTALATLVVSAALFLTALLGIASIDPNAGAAPPAGAPAIYDISLDQKHDGTHYRDCPYRDSHGGPLAVDGVKT